jgi:hypothetical protein
MADAADSKSAGVQAPCRFESDLGHQFESEVGHQVEPALHRSKMKTILNAVGRSNVLVARGREIFVTETLA